MPLLGHDLRARASRAAELRALAGLELDLAEGRIPGRSILDGLSIFAGGALLLTPGLLTDLLGLTELERWDELNKRSRVSKRSPHDAAPGGFLEFGGPD